MTFAVQVSSQRALEADQGSVDGGKRLRRVDFHLQPMRGQYLQLDLAGEAFVARSEGVMDPIVGDLEPNSPAVAAGFHRGDKILELDGRRIRNWDEVQQYVGMRPETPIRITVERGEDSVELDATPAKMSSRTAL